MPWKQRLAAESLKFFYAAETTAAHLIVSWMGLGNNNMTPEYRASLDPRSAEWALRVKGSKMNIVGWFTYLTVFWLLKSCWAIYYSKMTCVLHTQTSRKKSADGCISTGIDRMDVRIKIAWGLIVTTFIACICVICFQCRPFHRNWQINPNPGSGCDSIFKL